MIYRISNILFFTVIILMFTSCENDDIDDNNLLIDNNVVINNWIYKTMSNYYYWNDHIDESSLDKSSPPPVFFRSLLFEKDKFSWIMEDKKENSNLLHGNIESIGFEYTLGYKNEQKNEIFGLVLYVHPNSLADINGMKRGDLFDKINNISLDINNQNELLNLNKSLVSFYRSSEDDKSFTIEIERAHIQINPIYKKEIFKVKNINVGYICYNQFIADNGDQSNFFKSELLNAFSEFRDNNIQELIIDLRYNPGGLIDLAVVLSSLIVPNIDITNTALIADYNDILYLYFRLNNIDIDMKFRDHGNSYVGNNLKRVFFITGPNTASASEVLINSLLPYTEVVLVGETTYGKNYGSAMFVDDDKNNNNWAIQPIIMKLLNSSREANYENGFTPQVKIDELQYKLVELGNIEEPLLKHTLNIITGQKNHAFSKTRSTLDKCQIGTSIDKYMNLPMIVFPSNSN